ncbi:hypothetical protein CVV68_11055 [Arthrobacter livingstonensis]|uniref:DUF2339 domain-containing protein n=1 Tax=Arthrobacter livingstonensis TaxID=670078 RepID=A0A2V5L7N6_9MICC|nr:hypothetical protein CVV68_11055 [Arthrobacter livingstonensis]
MALAARKAKRETQNINITLYIASLLMVAAAALFVASSLPVPARLIGVWTAAVLFYGAGLALHGTMARLRPAAAAFTGTALAIIPFAGLATYNLGFPHAAGVWLLTSLVGTAAYILAAVRLNSPLVGYLSMAFLLSTAWSSVAVLGAALAWYFTALIVFSAVLYLAGHLLGRQAAGPDGKPGLYAKPLAELGPWFAPAGLAGSLVFSLALSAGDHAMVLLAGALYYAVMAWLDAAPMRRWNFLGLRLSLTLAAPFVGWLWGGTFAWAVGVMALVLAVQAVAMAQAQARLGAWMRRPGWPRLDVFISVPAVALLSAVWSVSVAASRHDAGAWVWSPALPLVLGMIVAMAAVPPLLPVGEWLPLPAIAAAVFCSPVLAAQDWMILLAVALAYSVARFATSKNVAVRRIMLVAARVLLTALVATALAAYVPAQDGKAEIIMAAVAVIAAGQLLADTAMARLGVPNPVTAWSGTAWAVVGTTLFAVLAAEYAWAGGPGESALRGAIGFAATASAVAMAGAALTHSAVNLPRHGAYAVAEFMAPAVGVAATLSALAVHGQAGASVGWGALMLFSIGMGLRLQGNERPAHRWLYWRAARLASLFLAAALHGIWRDHALPHLFGGAPVTLGMVLLLVLGIHLAVLAVARWRNHRDSGLEADDAATLGLVVVIAAVDAAVTVLDQADQAGWLATAAVGLCVAAIAFLGVAAAVRPGGWGTSAWLAPIAMVAVAGLRAGDRHTLEVVLAVVVASAAVCAVKAAGHRLRSAHFLLGCAAATALIGTLVAEFTSSPTVLSLVLCALLVLQLGVQWLVRRPAAVPVVGEPAVLRVSLWLLLAGQSVLPLAYIVDAGGLGLYSGGHRWVVTLELAVLAVSSVAAQSAFRQRAASYLAIFSVACGAAVMAPVAWPGATALVLAALSVAAIAWRCLHTPKTGEMRWYWLAATGVYLVTAAVVDHDAGAGIFALTWLVSGLAFVAGAHVQKLPWLTLPGALMVLLAAALMRTQVLETTGLPGFSSFAGFVVLLGALYLVRLVFSFLAGVAPVQHWSVLVVALGGGLVFALMSMADRDFVLLGAAAFTAVAALARLEAPAPLRRAVTDVAVVAAALAWFWASSVHIPLGAFWLVQWLAVAVGVLAAIRHGAGQPRAANGLLLGAAILASVGGLMTFFSGESLQQLVSLLLFAALMVVGLTADNRRLTIWGAIGVATAVLWYLRGFTFVLLALLALALIGFAVWRLNRKKPAAAGAPPLLTGHHPPSPHWQASHQQAGPQVPPVPVPQYPSAPPQYPSAPPQYPPAPPQYPPAPPQ